LNKFHLRLLSTSKEGNEMILKHEWPRPIHCVNIVLRNS
jgi:hypothetical protein